MNLLDMRTVIISYGINNFICMIVIFTLWKQNHRRFAGLAFWLADFVMQFIGMLLIALRGIVPDSLSVIIGNTMLVGGTLLLYVGLQLFINGKYNSQNHNYVLLGVFILANAYFVFVQPNVTVREIILSLGLLVICAQCAWLLLHQSKREMRPMSTGVGVVFIIYCIVSLIRIFVNLDSPTQNDFFHSNLYDTALVLIYQLLFIILTFNLFLMVSRRLFADLENDIVVRQQIEAALSLSEEKFHKAFQASPDAIIISRMSDGNYVEVNDGYVKLSGYSREEVLNSSSIKLGHWVNPQDREVIVDALQKNHSIHDYEIELNTKIGEIKLCLVSGETIQLNNEAHILWVIRDISERKRNEKILRQSEANFREVFDFTAHGIFIIEVNEDGSFRIGNSNKAEELLTSVPRDAVMGKSLEDAFPLEVAQMLHANYSRALEAGEPITYEEDVNLPGVGPRSYYTTLVPVRNEMGRFYRLIGSTLEISERKRMEDALRFSEEKFYKAFHSSPDAVLISRLSDGKIEDVNDGFCRLFGYSREEAFSATTIALGLWVNLDERETLVRDLKQLKSVQGREYQLRSRVGALIETLYSGEIILLEGEEHVVSTMHDLTQQNQAQRELLAAQMQIAVQQQELARDEERQRIARNLHDSLSQSIHSLVLFAETLDATIQKGNYERAQKLVNHVTESARQAHKETRLLLYELQALGSHKIINLAQELEERLEKVERHTGIKAELIKEGVLNNCPPEYREDLYWIAIEALNNALKHAQARNIKVMIRCLSECVELDVYDDGKGFDLELVYGGGMGLSNMRTRAQQLGGKLTIGPGTERGTLVHFSLERNVG